jgi:hypothetical protein
MEDFPQTAVNVIDTAADSVLSTGVVGGLLLMSLIANVALVWALVRSYRYRSQVEAQLQTWLMTQAFRKD